jgi:hypothetical protein
METVLTYVALNVFVLAFIAVFIRLIIHLSLTPIQRDRLRQERKQLRQEKLIQIERLRQEKLIQRERLHQERERQRKDKHSISTSCPDCGRFVSKMAYACPGCGRLSKAAASRAKTQSCAMILLVWVLCGIIFNGFIYGFIKGFISGLNNR